jgi:hypothetical protein
MDSTNTKTTVTLKNAQAISLEINPGLRVESYRAFRTSPRTYFVSADGVKAIAIGPTKAAAWKSAALYLLAQLPRV